VAIFERVGKLVPVNAAPVEPEADPALVPDVPGTKKRSGADATSTA